MPTQKRPKGIEMRMEELPIAVKTLVIDGKRMTASFYRQIVEERLINEDTGELCGIPFGSVNVHQKDCPAHWHLHTLWSREGTLRQGLVCHPADSQRYLELQQQSQKRREEFMDLLALMLSQQARTPEDNSYFSWDDNPQRHLVSLGGYNNLSVSSKTYQCLVQLEQARACLEQEQKTEQEQPLAHQSTLDQPLTGPQYERARQVRERLKQQAIVLAHPDLDQHYPELKTYQHDYTERQHSRYTQDTRWIVYYASSSPTGKKSSRLIWTPTGKQTWNQFTDAEIKPIESQLEPHVKPLRVILAEEVVEKHLTRIAREIRQRSEKLGLFTSQATQKPPDGSKVWAAFQKERQRFDAYTTRWQDQVAALLTLDQVFIVS